MALRAQRVWLQIATPLLAVGVAALLTVHIPVLRNKSSLLIFLGAVIVSMRLGGWLAGFFAAVLSAIACSFFLMLPLHSLTVSNRGDAFRLGIFILISLLILALYGSRNKAERALHASEQRLALALDSAHLGVWDYNLLTRKFWWSTTLEIIYARTDGTFPSAYGRFFACIHFDDQPLFNRAITRTIDEGTDYEVDHRIILPDESIRWVNTRGRVFFNQASRAERIVGIATDITARKRQEQQHLQRDAVA